MCLRCPRMCDAVPAVCPAAACLRRDIPIIVTCREVGGEEGWGPLRKDLLSLGITGGATHVDIEVEAPTVWKEEMIALARQNGALPLLSLPSCWLPSAIVCAVADVKVIVSHHNYDSTPDTVELRRIVEECFTDGADIAKIAVAAQTTQDAARVLSLHDDPRQLVLLAMGHKGQITRVAGPLLGAPFTFVAASEAAATAPGQLTRVAMGNIYEALM